VKGGGAKKKSKVIIPEKEANNEGPFPTMLSIA
jgi:hypothetical protein